MRKGCMAAGRVRAVSAVALLVMGGALGCTRTDAAARAEAADMPPAARVNAGTARMADTLAAIAARGLANPEANPFLNRARADRIQSMLLGQSGADGFVLREEGFLRVGERGVFVVRLRGETEQRE